MRLAKYLAHAGVASRRAAEDVIRAGRVVVDGQTVLDPARDVGEHNQVMVDGEAIAGAESRVVYALNKPRGVVSTARDTHGRPTVVELVARPDRRLYPVGRLDADSTGLILLTNDGELAHRLTHPSFELARTYRARVAGPLLREPALQRLRDGIRLEDGLTAPTVARRLGPHELEITLREGRNHQVRRMCEAIGHPVRALTRIRFGPLELGDLKLGAYRRLGGPDVARLRDAVWKNRAP